MHGLPYIDVPLSFGPIKTFGLLLFGGVMLGSWMCRKYCERNELDVETARWLGVRLVVWGFIGAVALDIVFYQWPRFLEDPWKTARALPISSYGAIVTSCVAFFYYSWRKGLDRRRWGDMAAWGVSGGWLLGRLGCAVAHDHPGLKTDSPFGVNFPPLRYPLERSNEVIRAHDLGLDEFFLWILLVVLVVLLERWRRRWPGFLIGALALAYSIPRFLFEFLRPSETDPRYLGLTFAQWASLGVLLTGLWLLLVRPDRAPSMAAQEGE